MSEFDRIARALSRSRSYEIHRVVALDRGACERADVELRKALGGVPYEVADLMAASLALPTRHLIVPLYKSDTPNLWLVFLSCWHFRLSVGQLSVILVMTESEDLRFMEYPHLWQCRGQTVRFP